MIAFIDDHRGAYGVEPICKVLPIAPSTYHAHAPSADPETTVGAAQRDALKPEIRRVFDENFRSMACARSGGRCSAKGFDIARCTVARLMRIWACRASSAASRSHDGQRQGGALPARSRQPPVPCTGAEHAVGLGLHLRRDLVRASSTSPSSSTPTPAASSAGASAGRRMPASCSMPWSRRCMTAGPVIAAASSTTATAAANTSRSSTPSAWPRPGIEPSVGSVGDSYDNALAETINGLYKAEVIHRRGPWRSFEAVEFATLEWVDWFNNRRLLEPIGNIPPAEAEERYYAMLDEPPWPRDSNQMASGKPGAVQRSRTRRAGHRCARRSAAARWSVIEQFDIAFRERLRAHRRS
jgi:putative transposase